MGKRIVAGILALLLVVVLGTATLAASDYTMDRWTIDNGGGTSRSTDGSFVLSGTIGQPEMGSTSDGAYEIRGGFWQSFVAFLEEFWVFVPVVFR